MRYVMTVCCLAALTASATLAADDAYERRYEVRFLDPPQAERILKNQCPPDPSVHCRVWSGGGAWVVSATTDVHERVAAVLAIEDVAPRTQAFNIVLVKASRNGGAAIEGLPEAARRALEDVADFFPFDHYELLDSAFMRTTAEAEVALSGPNDEEYLARLTFSAGPDGEGRELFVRRFQLSQIRWRVAPMRPGLEPGAAIVPTLSTETMIGTSFSMRAGETIVVGTSKLEGGTEALIVLLTAAD